MEQTIDTNILLISHQADERLIKCVGENHRVAKAMKAKIIVDEYTYNWSDYALRPPGGAGRGGTGMVGGDGYIT